MAEDHLASADPRAIMRMATGYWESQCLLTANRVRLFELLAKGPMPAEAVATALDFAPRPTRLFLKACVGVGLLEEVAGGFRNNSQSTTFLVPGSPAYLGNAVRYADDMWAAWGQLDDALRDGEPRIRPELYTGQDPDRTRHFVRGMHERALGVGAALANAIDLSGRRRLLDVGGGPGTYAALFVRTNPGLRATVLDLPEVVELAAKILESMGVSDRVNTVAGDYKHAAFPDGHDVVLISGVFHRESEATCRDLIRRASAVLPRGGRLIVADVFTDEGGATPSFAALFGLNMLLSATDGGVHADADVAAWLGESGFTQVERRPLPPPLPHRVVTGVLRA